MWGLSDGRIRAALTLSDNRHGVQSSPWMAFCFSPTIPKPRMLLFYLHMIYPNMTPLLHSMGLAGPTAPSHSPHLYCYYATASQVLTPPPARQHSPRDSPRNQSCCVVPGREKHRPLDDLGGGYTLYIRVASFRLNREGGRVPLIHYSVYIWLPFSEELPAVRADQVPSSTRTLKVVVVVVVVVLSDPSCAPSSTYGGRGVGRSFSPRLTNPSETHNATSK